MSEYKRELLELAESLRVGHHRYDDEDGWNSCPEHPEYTGNEQFCDCNYPENNKIVDKLVFLISQLEEVEDAT